MSTVGSGILAAAPRVSDTYVFSGNGRVPIAGFSKYKPQLDALMLAEAVKERGKAATIARPRCTICTAAAPPEWPRSIRQGRWAPGMRHMPRPGSPVYWNRARPRPWRPRAGL